MKKNQLVLAVGGGISAVLVLGSAVLTWVGMSGAGKARKARDKAFANLSGVYRSDPFPSAENVAAARDNLADAQDWAARLDEWLVVGTNDWAQGVNLRRATPGEFSSMREETLQGLFDAAPVGDDGAKIVPDAFAFGFQLYADGEPAQSLHVVRLIRQLRLTDKLVRMLYDSGIQHLDAVARIVFEQGGADASSDEDGRSRRSRRSRGGGRGAAAVSDLAVRAPAPVPGAVPSDVERFGFRFVAREKAVLDFVDRIDAMSPWACVSGLSLEKTGPDVVFPGEENEKEGGRRAKADKTKEEAAPAAPPGAPPKPAPRASRMVSGPLREAPVRATVFVDVRFIGREPSAAGAAGEEEEE